MLSKPDKKGKVKFNIKTMKKSLQIFKFENKVFVHDTVIIENVKKIDNEETMTTVVAVVHFEDLPATRG